MNIKNIVINKNRGWRGLAEVRCYDEDYRNMLNKMIFSFSQNVWDDMQEGHIVLGFGDYCYVIAFSGADMLPKGQRSVLIKDFTAKVNNVARYDRKSDWESDALSNGHYLYISNFIRNENNHTTSDWNCIGLRVIPEI